MRTIYRKHVQGLCYHN